MGTVLITGGSGLLGSAISRNLAGDYSVIGMDVRPPAREIAGVGFIPCDLTSNASVQQAAKAVSLELEARGESRLASIIHLAAYYDFTGKPSGLYQTLTLDGTERMLRDFRRFAPEQFVFASTLLVMAPSESGAPLTERDPVVGQWDYPRSKIAAEDLIGREHGDIPAVILRVAGVYDDEGHSPPIANQIDRIYRKTLESYFFPGDKHRGQSFVHLRDVVTAFRRVVESRSQLGPHEVFLLGEPDVMSYEELQEQIGQLLHGRAWPAVRIPKPMAKAGAWAMDHLKPGQEEFIKPWMIDMADAHYPVTIDKARRLLGWMPAKSLRDTLPRIVGSLRADPLRWYEQNKINPPDDEELRRGDAA